MKNSGIRHCEYCGANIMEGLNRCPVCKTKINFDKTDEESTENKIYFDGNDIIVEEDKIECSECGLLIDSECEICPNCGNKITKEENQENDNSRVVIFVILYIAILLSIFVAGPLALVASLVVAVTGKIVCPKSDIMTIILAISIMLLGGAILFVVCLLYACSSLG